MRITRDTGLALPYADRTPVGHTVGYNGYNVIYIS